MNRKIPIFRLDYPKEFRQEFYQLCEEVFNEAYLTNHTMVRRFESQFSKFNNSKHVIAVNNGTSAIEVMLRALDLKGKKVLIPTHTFIASAIAVLNAGGEPVPVDICVDELGPKLVELEKLASSDVGAIMLVHLGGIISSEVKKICEFSKQKKILVIEDCAHAHGSSHNHKTAGQFGVAGAFSFHLTKTVTMGEGGAIVTEDFGFSERCRSVRQFGMDNENSLIHIRPGSNFKMTEMQAALGLIELKRAQSRIKRRNEIATIYQARLGGLEGLKVLKPLSHSTSGYYKQIMTSEKKRDVFLKAFEQNDIMMTGGVYYYPLHRQPIMKPYVQGKSFPDADWFADHHFCPPCYPELVDDEVYRICDVIEKTLKV